MKVIVNKNWGSSDKVKTDRCGMIEIWCHTDGTMNVIRYGAEWRLLKSKKYSSKAYAVKKAKEIIEDYAQAYIDGEID